GSPPEAPSDETGRLRTERNENSVKKREVYSPGRSLRPMARMAGDAITPQPQQPALHPAPPRGNSGPEAFRPRTDDETRRWNGKAASVASLRKFASEDAAVYDELRQRGTKIQRLLFTAGAILALAAHAGAAAAQDYPVRTVRIVVPYAPGGGVSLLAQTVANK